MIERLPSTSPARDIRATPGTNTATGDGDGGINSVTPGRRRHPVGGPGWRAGPGRVGDSDRFLVSAALISLLAAAAEVRVALQQGRVAGRWFPHDGAGQTCCMRVVVTHIWGNGTVVSRTVDAAEYSGVQWDELTSRALADPPAIPAISRRGRMPHPGG
jgi:hypothetical protein